MSKEYLEENLKRLLNDTPSKFPTGVIHKKQYYEINIKDLKKTNNNEYNIEVVLCDLEWYLTYYPYGDPIEIENHNAIYLELFRS